MTLQIAALASGTGSNIASIIAAISDGRLNARMCVVLSNNPLAGALDIARAAGVRVWAKSHKDFFDRESFDNALFEVIRESGADTVVLAGYMRLLSPSFVRAFQGRMLNIHPAVLPSFPGVHGGRDAIEYGVRFSGATVHFVDEAMDTGPVIIQAVVPVMHSDSEKALMARIHAMEHRIYPQALQWLEQGRLRLHGRRVELIPDSEGGAEIAATLGESGEGPWMVSPALEAF